MTTLLVGFFAGAGSLSATSTSRWIWTTYIQNSEFTVRKFGPFSKTMWRGRLWPEQKWPATLWSGTPNIIKGHRSMRLDVTCATTGGILSSWKSSSKLIRIWSSFERNLYNFGISRKRATSSFQRRYFYSGLETPNSKNDQCLQTPIFFRLLISSTT